MNLIYRLPCWLAACEAELGGLKYDNATDRMRVAIALARHNIANATGGPFGAAVFAADGRLVAAGINIVTSGGASHLHAEVVALARAEKALAVHDLAKAGKFTLYTSVAPCVMCFGAIFWSGVSGLVCGATTADAEAIGFNEGPKPRDWANRLRRSGISVTERLLRNEARAVLQAYAANGGELYNSSRPKHQTDQKMSWADTARAMASGQEDWSEWDGTVSDGHETIP